MNLFFRQTGEGKPLIILHGVFGSSDNWLSIQKAISEFGFSVYALDARNHGRSSHSDIFNYDAMADDLAEFIAAQQIEKPILIGHSMGGKVVMQFAMNYPNVADAFIVVDIAPRFYPVHHDHILRGLHAIPLETLKSRNDAEQILSQYEPHAGTRLFLLKNLYRNDTGQFSWRINLPVITQEIHNIGPEPTQQRTVTEPTLFLRGSESSYIADEDHETIQRLFPNASIQTIEGAGHWVQADQPQAFIEAVTQWINNIQV